MAESFVNIEVEDDAFALSDEVIAAIQDRWPDWEPADANLETFLIDAFSRMTAEVRDLALDVMMEVFKEFGKTIANVPPDEGAAATTTTTWTMVDNAGYTIPAGTQVGFLDADRNYHVFRTVEDVEVPNGSTATSAGEVEVWAIENGADANDLTNVRLIDALAFVDSIEAVSATSGGADEETDTDYLNRLSQELQLLSPTPILPADFEVLARRIDGVYRAKAIDLWDPSDDSLDNERYIGIVCIDEDGEDVAAGIKTAVNDYLESLREANFVINVSDPDYTTIDVTTTVQVYPGYTPAEVQTAVEDALNDFLSPARWGLPPYRTQDTGWDNIQVVRISEVSAAINDVPGVDYVDSLTVEGGSVDVNLSGVVTLTRPGTISVTANA